MGFSQTQMEEKFDRIVDFAGLAEFINAPLRTYSSGMMMRLGFSIATDVDPDVLIIDEILGVGDEEFQKKCQKRMERFHEKGTTILFVSHSMESVQSLCTRAVWIEEGKIQASGPVCEVVDAYRKHA
jgi:ABC-type polysaccharide/polyol phosphate transport system ATPase subunit